MRHVPVLLEEMIASIPDSCHRFLDGTLGHAGHAQAVISLYNKQKRPIDYVGIDRDDKMLSKARVFIEEAGLGEASLTFLQGTYADLETISNASGGEQFDYILLDIGVNMDHFKVAERGFSLKLDGDLDMRFDTHSGIPVSKRLEKASYNDLRNLFTEHTDFSERFNEKVVKELAVVKKKTPLHTTHQFRDWAKSFGINDKKLAVIFQALRIVVNKELEQLDTFLESFAPYLSSGGRCAIMTYHSGEDRKVKYAFKKLVENGVGVHYNKKVITPVRTEVKRNKAARSAKLRVFEKI